jgi:hypothetical protein
MRLFPLSTTYRLPSRSKAVAPWSANSNWPSPDPGVPQVSRSRPERVEGLDERSAALGGSVEGEESRLGMVVAPSASEGARWEGKGIRRAPDPIERI